MNQTSNHPPKEPRIEDDTLVLLEIAKAIDEVKQGGFGEVRVYIQNGRIYRWELVRS